MEENTIFQGAPLDVAPDATTPTPQGSTDPALVGALDGSELPPAPASGFPYGTIVKIALGIILLLIVGFVVFFFVSGKFGKPSDQEVTLTYWGLWEDKAVMETVIADFEREHPKIKVAYEKRDPKQYKETLQTRIKNDTGPDIFRFHNTWRPQLTADLSPLPESVIKKDVFKSAYYPVIQKDLTNNGAIYGIPLGFDTLALFTNTDLLSTAGVKVPTTWEEFNSASRTLVVEDGDKKIKTSGAALGTYDNITHAPDIISLLFAQNGADMTDLTKTQTKSSDALRFYTSFAFGDAHVWDSSLDPSLLAFTKGSLAMYFGYSWDIFTIKTLSPDLKFSVSSVPSLPGRTMTIASYWVEGVSTKSKHKDAAYIFMQFLARKETAQKIFQEASKKRLFGEPYARIDLGQTLSDNPLVYPFVKQGPIAVSSYFVGDTYDDGFNGALNTYLGNAVRGVLSNTSPESAVETLSKGVAQVLSQYGQ